MQDKSLYFFTNSHPYGRILQWKLNELEHFQKDFSKVTFVPFCYGTTGEFTEVPENVAYEEPFLPDGVLVDTFEWQHLISIFNGRFWFYIKEFIGERVYASKDRIIRWLDAVIKTERILKSESYRKLIKIENKQQAVLYFFWGLGSSFAIPFLSKYNFAKIVVRFHGYDLYKERNGGYIPFRGPLLDSLTIATPISQLGVDYLTKNKSGTGFKARVMRLGVHSKGGAGPSSDGILHLVSCSVIISLKRVDLIINALKLLNFKVEWVHMGDGDQMGSIKELAATLPSNAKAIFKGWVPSNEVVDYYAENVADLFINVSRTEGVPVSAMEAMAAGVPVYATNVGGTKEIVDEKVGKLLDENISPIELAESIKEFHLKREDDKALLRKNAVERYEQMCDVNVLAQEYSEFLSK